MRIQSCRVFPSLALLSLVLTVGPAAAQDVKTDYDKSVDFANYRTYYWEKDKVTNNDIMNQRFVDAVDGQLQAKGWRRQEGSGDAALAAHLATQDKKSINTFYSGWGPGWGWGGVGGTGTTTVTDYTEGTLVLDIFDTASKKLIWRGTASDTISDNPEKNAKKINKAAEKWFKKFPPQQTSDR